MLKNTSKKVLKFFLLMLCVVLALVWGLLILGAVAVVLLLIALLCVALGVEKIHAYLFERLFSTLCAECV